MQDAQNGPPELSTARLVLRKWKAADRAPFARMNADPIVMEYLPAPLSADESNAFVDRIERHFDELGWGLWAVEVRATESFVGYVGLWPATFAAHFTPAVEVGWRLAQAYWNHGYATEAAKVVLNDGFDRLGFDEIVSFTAVANARSQRVMQKLGMTHDPHDDFDHPNLPAGHRLQRHVLYRVTGGVRSREAGRRPGLTNV
jgi:RimJ/RimL family protein N-acetyltransferase